MLMMLSLNNDNSIMDIAKHGFKSTHIHFTDAQTCRFYSYNQNVTMAGHIMDVQPSIHNEHYFGDIFKWALIPLLTSNYFFSYCFMQSTLWL